MPMTLTVNDNTNFRQSDLHCELRTINMLTYVNLDHSYFFKHNFDHVTRKVQMSHNNYLNAIAYPIYLSIKCLVSTYFTHY